MKLKGRLKLIADKVPVCKKVFDVGSDHAYLPIYLVEKKIASFAVASDLREGPASAARRNIEKWGLDKLIDVRVGNGLEPLMKDEADVIIIAGMGGMLIADILSRDYKKAVNTPYLILQPMNAVEVVREWLYQNGFDIVDEELVSEGRKIYIVLVCKWDGTKKNKEDIYYYIGEKLVEKRDPLLIRYLEQKTRQFQVIVDGMACSGSGEETVDYKKNKEILDHMQALLGRMKEEGRER